MSNPAPVERQFDPDEMASRGRLGGLRTSMLHDPHEYTRNARDAFMRRFEDEVDPDRQLSEDERQRRAEAAKRLHFQRMAFKSAKARRVRDGGES